MKYATPIVNIHCYRNCVFIYLLKTTVDSKIDIYIFKKDNTVLNCCTIAEGKKNIAKFSATFNKSQKPFKILHISSV